MSDERRAVVTGHGRGDHRVARARGGAPEPDRAGHRPGAHRQRVHDGQHAAQRHLHARRGRRAQLGARAAAGQGLPTSRRRARVHRPAAHRGVRRSARRHGRGHPGGVVAGAPVCRSAHRQRAGPRDVLRRHHHPADLLLRHVRAARAGAQRARPVRGVRVVAGAGERRRHRRDWSRSCCCSTGTSRRRTGRPDGVVVRGHRHGLDRGPGTHPGLPAVAQGVSLSAAAWGARRRPRGDLAGGRVGVRRPARVAAGLPGGARG